ncbi:MAG: hypothetical protein E7231_00455 [Cellulosilyticum sp.]|nr:hypothetical protein [Cellulosilyticum sp.]
MNNKENGLWAKVLTVNTINQTITVQFDSGDSTEKPYKYPKTGYTPQIGDRAYFINDVCIGIY